MSVRTQLIALKDSLVGYIVELRLWGSKVSYKSVLKLYQAIATQKI